VRIDDRTIRMVVKRKDGSISRTSTMAFVDGQLTESTDVSIPNGGAMKSKVVYEKQ